MNTYTQRLQTVQKQSAAGSTTSKNTAAITDNRPEAVTQLKLKSSLNETGTHQNSVVQLAKSIKKKKDEPKVPGITKTIKKTRKYSVGQHGYKKYEQQRLKKLLGKAVSGKTHQSEHYFGFAALNQTSGQSRKESGEFERNAYAYQEAYQSHRDHVGTGSSKQIGPTGLSSETYRNDTRMLLESGDVSSAGQLNTLGYAFQPDFSKRAQTIEGQQASNSFTHMMSGMDSVSYMQGNKQVSVPVSDYDRLEQLAARYAVERKHSWPTDKDIADARKALGM